MSKEIKKSVVMWILEKLANSTFDYMAGVISKNEYEELSKEIVRQAKEMEKERIENAFNSGYNNGGLDTCLTPKQYYNETYGGNK